jgi:hypothetical protein
MLKRLRRYAKGLIGRAVFWAVEEHLNLRQQMLMSAIGTGVANAEQSIQKKLRSSIAGLQAIDCCFNETGKVILVARIGKRDIVKIVDCKPEFTMEEYKRLVRDIELSYGVRPTHWDMPAGHPRPDWRV